MVYNLIPITGRHLWYTTHHNIGQYSHTVMLLDLISIGTAVRISLLSRIAALHVVWYSLPVPGRHLQLSTHLTWSCTNIRPTTLFDAQDMLIPLKFHIYSICNVRFKCFRFHVRHFALRFNSHRTVHRAMLLSPVVTSASSKTNAATLNLFTKVIYALWFNVHQVITFSPPSLPVT